ncbi:MAG: periplasmic heavy metal sensor [Deltaproteobacteria bacterium]|nr:periplasmic heavy metal sensor [Deltaproteobacteria bacterium]
MLKKNLTAILLAGAMVAPMVVHAQDILPGKWWRMPRLEKQLDLTQNEKDNLDDLFVDSRRKLIDLRSAVQKERFELENLLEKDPLDETAVARQFKKLEKARSDLTSERFRFALNVRKILGLERYERLKNAFKQMRKRNRRAGRPRPSGRQDAQ